MLLRAHLVYQYRHTLVKGVFHSGLYVLVVYFVADTTESFQVHEPEWYLASIRLTKFGISFAQ